MHSIHLQKYKNKSCRDIFWSGEKNVSLHPPHCLVLWDLLYDAAILRTSTLWLHGGEYLMPRCTNQHSLVPREWIYTATICPPLPSCMGVNIWYVTGEIIMTLFIFIFTPWNSVTEDDCICYHADRIATSSFPTRTGTGDWHPTKSGDRGD